MMVRFARCAALLLISIPLMGSSSPRQNARNWKWIWTGEKAGDGACFRQPFVLSENPVKAELRIAGRGPFTVYFDGNSAMTGTGTDDIQTVTVTRFLHKGRNLLAIECLKPRAEGGIAFQLDVTYQDERRVRVVSDADVRTSARRDGDWKRPDFDDKKWAAARVVGNGPGEQERPAQNPALSKPQTSSTPRYVADASRILRVWDFAGSAKPGENSYAVARTAGDRMILTSNVSAAADFPLLRSAGFTLLQTDSDHLSTEETAPGVWDFGAADSQLRLARDNGFDWCYFPHYAFPPKWYTDSTPYTRLRDLQFDKEVAAFSPWDPKFSAFVKRGYEKLGEKYGGLRGASALNVGIHGDYGEAGLLMGARLTVPETRDEWKKRFGDTHNYLGWWCGDVLARANFRESMMKRYGSLEVLNAAWKTKLTSMATIDYPKSVAESNRRHWLDFVHWYRESVAGMVDAIGATARASFPNNLLMLPMGFADENPRGGHDNSLLVKMAVKNRLEVRSTHAGYRPFANNQATIMGRIASAARQYGAPFWLEPPGRLSTERQVSRIFAAASMGAHGIYDSAENIAETRDVYYRYNKYLRVDQPVVDVAMFFPTTSLLLRPELGYPPVFEKGLTDIRDVLNYETLDERMILDGGLEKFRLLVLWEGTVIESTVLTKIREWVQNGGVIVAYDFGKIESVEGARNWFNDLFEYAGKLNVVNPGLRFVPSEGKSLPGVYRINVGQPTSVPYLAGDWYEADSLPGAASGASISRRWSGANAEFKLPVNPNRDYTFTLRASYPTEAPNRKREILVNGRKIGELTSAADTTYLFKIPTSLLDKKEVATITIKCDTFVPGMVFPDSRDNRALGVWVTYAQMDSTAGPAIIADPGTPEGRFETVVDYKKLKSDWAKPYGKGWTVFFPATRKSLTGYYEVIRYLTYHLSEIDPMKRDAIAVDDAWDGAYATLFADRILYYNPAGKPIARTISLPKPTFEKWPEVRAPKDFVFKLELDATAIGSVFLDAQPAEMLLQCEKFTDLGKLKPSEGATFSPGSGATHVLLPQNSSISTNFQVDVAGRYRLFYHTFRRGGLAAAELLIDGKLVTGTGAAPRERNAAARLAGTVELAPGVHSLTLRPKKGEDVRADFVVLTTDPTIAGYGFAVKPVNVSPAK